MAEKKQPRDKNGHFASYNDAVLKEAKSGKTSKASVSQKGKGISLEDAYERKVLELIKAKEQTQELNLVVEDQVKIISDLRNKLEEANETARFFEGKAKAYFITIEMQNNYISSLRNAYDFLLCKLPLLRKIRFIHTIDETHDKLCELRKHVLQSMNNWG